MGAPVLTHPGPIDPSFQPTSSIQSLPATSSIPDILAVLERDGGVILTDFVDHADLEAIDRELADEQKRAPTTEDKALHIIPKQTVAIPGLVGKSKTVAKICESPVLEGLRTEILQEKFTVIREDRLEENTIDPLLSISLTFNIGYGAPRQRLHRDDNVHGIRHKDDAFDLKKASQFACLIAGVRTTRENGATMFIPGSHKWNDERRPTIEEVCFAEMEPGSALIFLASCYHGGGHNAVPGLERKVHGLFFIRGTMRTEENQFLAVPRSKIPGMSEKMLSLLGYKKPTTVLGIVDNDDPARRLKEVLERANQ